MDTLVTVVTIIQVIAAVLLTCIVLFQSGKSAGLSGALAGNNDSFMGKTKAHGVDAKIARATKWVAAVFLLLTFALSLI